MSDTSYPGYQDPFSTAGEHNSLDFIIGQLLGALATATLVKVIAVYNEGTGPTGTVDVQPLVNQIDGAGNNATPHGTVYGIPYFRTQGGQNGFVCDPQVGDKGMCAFASRDISKVVSTGAQANPGSFRRFDMADGLYFGGFIGGGLANYVWIDPSGNIHIVSTGVVSINATGNATITAGGDVDVTASGTANILGATVNLGATGGPAVARVGDSVVAGRITTGSTIVNSG